MRIKRAVAIGYATLDYVIELAEQFRGTGTKTVKHLATGAWPRAGGAALYTCRQLAMSGIDAAPLTWIGTDAGAGQYEAACRESLLNTDGVVSQPGGTTPTCILIYQPDGDYGCLFEPGSTQPEELTAQQQSLIEAADLLLIAVGPPDFASKILALTRADAIVAWIAKTDHTAYPEHVRKMYAARADFVFCNSGEREFVDASLSASRRTNQVIVETRGSDGVSIDSHEAKIVVPVELIETPDTTGAGDTLAGATMAQILAGNTDLTSAVAMGIKQTGALLKIRQQA